MKGLGVAAIPRVKVTSELNAGTLITLDVGWPLMAPEMHAIWPGNASSTSLAARFVGYLVEWFDKADSA